MKIKKKLILKIAYCLIGFLIFGLSLFFYFWITSPSPNDLSKFSVSQTTKIYDRTGEVLLSELYSKQNRTVLKWEEIPSVVKLTTLAAEDSNFYHHPAFDIVGIGRALLHNLLHPTELQGGSTITQQLARNAFLTPNKNLIRKLRELVLAIKIETIYPKDKIFELYLNQVPYGGNAYGIEAASQLYFNKSAKDLSLAEAAYLASLLKSPTYLSPYGLHRDRLDARQQWVLNRLKELNWVPAEEVEKAKNEKVKFAKPTFGLKAPHFVMYIRDYLSQRYGEDYESMGLKVITSLDWRLQTIAEETVAKYSKINQEKVHATNMGMLMEDPKTGQILAMVGSHDYFDLENEGNFNVTLAQRQPGSAFKPFVYAAAFKKGFLPTTVVYDLKTNFSTDPNNPYFPNNYDLKFRGPVTLREALAQSLNVPSVKVLYLTGIDNAINVARSFGITTLTKPTSYYGLSLVLGGGAVQLNEMVNAYAVFSQEGVFHPQVSILRVEDSTGKVLEEYQEKSELVFEPRYCQMINDILSDEQARAPAFGSHSPLYVEGYDVAVKTGTSQDYRDAWTIGYSPNLVVGVWAGNNDYSPIQKGGAGIMVAAPAWHEAIVKALPYFEKENFNPPPLITSHKPMFDGQYIVNRTFQIDKTTGQLANAQTLPENIITYTYKEIHSILYYVNKDDPLGPIPQNPANDPQFFNWEMPVLNWARSNILNFDSQFNQPIPAQYLNWSESWQREESTSTTSSQPAESPVEFISPLDGQEVLGDFYLEVKTPSDIDEASLYLNGQLLGTMSKNQIGNFVYFISYNQLMDTNVLRVEIKRGGVVIGSGQITVYR